MTVTTPCTFVSTGVHAAGVCTVIGKDFQNRNDVGSIAIPPGESNVSFCTSRLRGRFSRGTANVVFVTDGSLNQITDNRCYFKNIPVGAPPPAVNVGYPRGTLVVFNGAGGAC